MLCLNSQNVELESINDYGMYLFIENGIRGGITQCVKRHVKANDTYLESSLVPEKANSFLSYLDANNLYGFALTKSVMQK